MTGFNFGKATDRDKDILLNHFLYKMSWETRQEIMNEYPLIYNRLCEREIMGVTNLMRP